MNPCIRVLIAIYLIFISLDSCNELSLEEIFMVKYPSSVQPLNYPSVLSSISDLSCLLNRLYGDFDRCKGNKWDNILIKNPEQLPSTIMILDIQGTFDVPFAATSLYFVKSDNFISDLLASMNQHKINSFYIGSKISSFSQHPTVFIDQSNLVAQTHEIGIKLEAHDGQVIGKEVENKLANSSSLMSAFVLKNLASIIKALNIDAKKLNLLYYPILSANQDTINEFADLSQFPLDAVVIMKMSSRKSSEELSKELIKQYSKGQCTLKDKSIICESGVESHLKNLCMLNTKFVPSLKELCEPDSEKAILIAQRAVSQSNPHNLYTYAEYTSNYAATFTMCAFSFLVLIIIFIIASLMIADIDISVHSILNKDAIFKQKSD